MSTAAQPRIALAAATACAVAASGLSPAGAATLSERDAAGQCTVTFSAAEKNAARAIFNDGKKIGDYERARDTAAALEQVYPGAKDAGDRASVEKLGLSSTLAGAYLKARSDAASLQPTAAATREAIDLENYKATADATGATVSPRIVTAFPADTTGVSAEQQAKLAAAWLATESGAWEKRNNEFQTSVRSAKQACALGTSTTVAFPEEYTPTLHPDVAGLSSGGSNFDLIAGAVITVVAAIIGVVAASPQLQDALRAMLPAGLKF